MADAKLVFVNGLGFEGWLPRLVKSAGGKAAVVTATTASRRSSSARTPIRMPGNRSPMRRSMSPISAMRWQRGVLPDAEAFKSKANAYLADLDALEREVREAIAQNSGRPPQGDLDPRCLRLFRRRLWRRIHRAARRLDRIRGQRPRYRGDHHPDQGRQNTGGVSGKYQRPPPDAAGYRPRPAPGSAERSIRTA